MYMPTPLPGHVQAPSHDDYLGTVAAELNALMETLQASNTNAGFFGLVPQTFPMT